jgi:hypothetical protein
VDVEQRRSFVHQAGAEEARAAAKAESKNKKRAAAFLKRIKSKLPLIS